MTVIQKHGDRKPLITDLKPFQIGYDNGSNVFGKHEGKEMFINDGAEIRSLNEGYLKEEFVDYVYPNNAVPNGGTIYEKTSDEDFHGILYSSSTSNKNVKDEDGALMGQKISVAFGKMDTCRKVYNDNCGGFEVFSVDPMYLAHLKDTIEQKALYVVGTYSEMIETVNSLTETKKLEPGVQFVVKNDEKNNKDSMLYVVSQFNTVHGIDDNEEAYIITTSQDSESLAIVALAPLEYKFHDIKPELVRNLGLEVEEDDVENKAITKFTKHTVDTIICAHDNAVSDVETTMGVQNGPDTELPQEITENMKRGQVYTNFIKLYNKVYNENGEDGKSLFGYIDFSNFVLDEGEW